MNLTVPEGRPLPAEIPVLDRGRLDANTHYVQGSDVDVMTPLNVTFTADLDDAINRDELRAALSNLPRRSPWVVGGLSFAATNGMSQILNGSGVLVSTPVPFHTDHLRVDLVTLWYGDTPGSNDDGRALREVWFSPDQVQLTEAEDAVRLAATGLWYGAISAISAFSAGSAV